MTVQGLGKQIYSIELRDLIAMSVVNALINIERQGSESSISERAYEWADAMLRAREIKTPPVEPEAS
jgi:hypothetical protein